MQIDDEILVPGVPSKRLLAHVEAQKQRDRQWEKDSEERLNLCDQIRACVADQTYRGGIGQRCRSSLDSLLWSLYSLGVRHERDR